MSAPKFNQLIELLAQWSVDNQNLLAALPGLFDVDTAVGAQLDVVGQWVGASRALSVPLTGVYFSLDIDGLGLDQGSLLGPYDPLTGIELLPDDQFRLLIYATIAANQWDGTTPGAYEAWEQAFEALGYSLLIQDNQDMTMSVVLVGRTPDALTRAMFLGGYINLKPAGVGTPAFYVPSVVDSPIFGLDADNDSISGLDVGAIAIALN